MVGSKSFDLKKTMRVKQRKASKAIVFFTIAIAFFMLPITNTAQAAGIADISILKNTSLVSNNGEQPVKNAEGNYDLDLTLEGTGAASVGLANSKVVVFTLPPALQGKVIGEPTVNVNAQLTAITPGDIPGVSSLVNTLGDAIEGLTSIPGIEDILGIDLDPLNTAFESVQNAQELGSYEVTVPGVVSEDGKTITVDFTEGLGEYTRSAFAGFFTPLREAFNELEYTGNVPGVNEALQLVKSAGNPLFDAIDEIANGSSDVLTQALDANLLGETNFNLNMEVSDPSEPEATVSAAAVNDSAFDVNVISEEGAQTTLLDRKSVV